MKLYLLSTKGLGDYYVAGESPNDAQEKLTALLEKADYGFYEYRLVQNIKLLSDEVGTDNPNFNDKSRFIQ